MRRARVLATHRAPDRPAIKIARGEVVTLGARDVDWPQFVWATRADGLGGWVPAALFERDRGPSPALDDYDTLELDADIGSVVRLHREQAQWWWASDADGRTGWIPARVLAPLPPSPQDSATPDPRPRDPGAAGAIGAIGDTDLTPTNSD